MHAKHVHGLHHDTQITSDVDFWTGLNSMRPRLHTRLSLILIAAGSTPAQPAHSHLATAVKSENQPTSARPL